MQILSIDREDKNGRRYTSFGFNNIGKNFLIYFAKIELFFTFGIKSSLSTSTIIFSDISEILETKSDVLWTQTCRNLKSIKFFNFLSVYALKKMQKNRFFQITRLEYHHNFIVQVLLQLSDFLLIVAQKTTCYFLLSLIYLFEIH